MKPLPVSSYPSERSLLTRYSNPTYIRYCQLAYCLRVNAVSGRGGRSFCDWNMRDFVKFSRWSSCGRNVYKSPETMISISSNKFASRPSAVHSTTISHTTPSTCKSHTLVLFTSTMDSFSSILAMKANDESSPISSTPVEEESSSSSGGCYCVIA